MRRGSSFISEGTLVSFQGPEANSRSPHRALQFYFLRHESAIPVFIQGTPVWFFFKARVPGFHVGGVKNVSKGLSRVGQGLWIGWPANPPSPSA